MGNGAVKGPKQQSNLMEFFPLFIAITRFIFSHKIPSKLYVSWRTWERCVLSGSTWSEQGTLTKPLWFCGSHFLWLIQTVNWTKYSSENNIKEKVVGRRSDFSCDRN